jgi:putative oxidoreductase
MSNPAESTMPYTAERTITTHAVKPSKAILTCFWIFTALFCLEMCFTAYWELFQLPQAAEAFARLGFSSNAFRVELSWAKVIGVAALLIPKVPARLKEWAYAGFAINLISAIIAHSSISDRPAAFIPSSLSSLLWALSYFFYRRLQATTSAV